MHRLIAQFPDSVLVALAGRLTPPLPGRGRTLAGHLARALATRQPAPPRDIRRRLWSALLAGLLRADGQPVSAESLCADVLARIARGLGREAPEPVAGAAGRARTPLANFGAALDRLLAPPPRAYVATGHDSAGADTADTARDDEDAALVAALRHGDATALESAWRDALRHPPRLLRHALAHEGAEAARRARFAEVLPESLLARTLRHLAPAADAFVTVLLARAPLFAAALGMSTRQPARVRRQLWAFILGYLAAWNGARFSARDCLDSLLGEAAALAGLSRRELAARLSRGLDGEAGADAAELRGLLVELARVPVESAETVAANVAEAEAAARGQKLMRGYDLLERLREALRGEFAGESSIPSGVVVELAERHPALWSRLRRELCAGAYAGERLGAGLEPAALRLIVLGLLAGIAATERGLRSARIATLARDIAGSDESAEVYRRVLRALARKRPAELDARSWRMLTGEALESMPAGSARARRGRIHDLAASRSDAGDVAEVPGASVATERTLPPPALAAEAPPAELVAMLAGLRRRGSALDRFVAAQPENQLTRLLFRLRGAEHHEIQVCADAIADACGFAGLDDQPGGLRDAKWTYILGEWLGEGRPFTRRDFARGLVRHLVARARWPDERGFRFLLDQQLKLDAVRDERVWLSATEGTAVRQPPSDARARGERLAALRAALAEGQRTTAAATVTPPSEPLPAPEPWSAPEATPPPGSAGDESDDHYIDNAGLVLAAPYLPRLFAMLDLLDGAVFRNAAAAERAAHLLQYLVDGREDAAPEFRLALNKLLCGIDLGTPLEGGFVIDERERQAVDGLLSGMLENWKGIGNTSVEGLRASFLSREGRLRRIDDAWHLLVAPRAYDMLLDTLPWGYSVIRHHWMRRVIHVSWR